MFVAILMGICIILFWLARERTYFLGDGYIILQWLSLTSGPEVILGAFKHEPLTGYLVWNLYNLFSSWQILSSAEFSMQCISICFGIGCIVLVALVARTIFSRALDGVLFSVFILISGGSQLFFGYIENYTPAYCGVVVYILLSIFYLRDKLPLIFPSMFFGVLFTLDFGMLALLPSLGVMFYREHKMHRISTIVLSTVAMVLTSMLLLWLCGYSFASFWEIFFNGEDHIVPVFQATGGWRSYTMFSLSHLLEVSNLYLLTLPFAPIFLIGVLITFRKQLLLQRLEWIFIILTGLLGLCFTLVFNTDIGMSRDWDLMSPFVLCSIVAAGYIGWQFVETQTMQKFFVIMIAINLFHCIPWVLVNADENRSLARFDRLPDEHLWGKNAFKVFEELGMYHRDHANFPPAIYYYEKYLDYDSTDTRIMGSLAAIYKALNNTEKEIYYYQKMIKYGPRLSRVYTDFSSVYAQQGRYDEAIEILKSGLERFPNSSALHMNIGVLLMRVKKQYNQALPYLQHALFLDSSKADSYEAVGLCYHYLGDSLRAKTYLSRYMEMRPNDPETQELREKIRYLK